MRKFVTQLGVLALILYAAFLLGRSMVKNYQTGQKITELEQQISAMQEEIRDINNQILYYQTDSFREREAREKLGLKKAGEQVVILPERDVKTDGSAPAAASVTTTSPNYLRWLQFLRGQW